MENQQSSIVMKSQNDVGMSLHNQVVGTEECEYLSNRDFWLLMLLVLFATCVFGIIVHVH